MSDFKGKFSKIAQVTLIGLVFSLIFGTMLFLNYTNFRDTLILNEQKRLLTIADTIARTLENHIQSQQDALLLLSRDTNFQKSFVDSFETGNPIIMEQVKTYYQIQRQSIVSVEIYNSDGRIVALYPDKGPAEYYLMYTDQFEKKSIQDEQKSVSPVFFENENVPYLYLSQPIYSDDEVIGVIRSKLSIDSVYRDFVEPIKSGGKGYASVKTSHGIFVMHPSQDQLGKEVLSLRKGRYPQYDWSDFEKLIEGQKSGLSGSGVYHSVWVTDDSPERVKKFNGYAPAFIGDDFWIVTVSSDYDETTTIIKRNLYVTVTILGLIGLCGIAGVLYISSLREKQRKMEVEARYLNQVKDLNKELEDDIEKRKILEKELVKSRSKFIKLFNTGSHLTIVMQAPDELENGLEIIEVNDYACKKLKYTRENLLAQTYKDIDVGLNRTILKNHVVSTESQEQIQFETQLKTSDGITFPVEVFAHRFKYDNKSFLMFVARDISLRIEQEEELEINRAIMIYKMQLAAMGEMVGSIAHQWRQPLSSLALINSNIYDAVKYGEDEGIVIEDLFTKSKQIIKSMSQTIDDFRHFFKPIEQKEIFSFEKCLKSSLDLCEERLKFYKIFIDLADVESLDILGYSNQLSQVLLNLLNNAADALVESKKEVRIIKISTRKDMDLGIIEVYDNGGGADENIVDKMFEPYFSTKSSENGTGLGLYMSKMIIEKNFKGKIGARNADEGIVFWISIPI